MNEKETRDELVKYQLMRVKIRRNLGRKVREGAEKIDGMSFLFYRGWIMEDADQYPGETAWLPRDMTYPADAPHWIASGDLVPDDSKPNE